MPSPRRIEPIAEPTLDSYRLPDGRPLDLFGMAAHSPAALGDLKGATARVLNATEVSPRLRELLILRILHNYGAVAEWQVHIALFAEDAQIAPFDLAALRTLEVTLPGLEGAFLEFADALCGRGVVSDELWRRIHEELGTRGAVEAVFIGAQYVKIALMNNVLRVEPPLPSA